MVNFDINREDLELVDLIVSIVCKKFPSVDRMSLHMDLIATHCNGCPLDLPAMLQGVECDFYHDIGGIMRHIDRKTGKLEGCFIPRFAKR